MIRYPHIYLPLIFAASGLMAMPLFVTAYKPSFLSCGGGSYGTMNWYEIEKAHRNNRRGKIIRRYR